MESPTAPYQHLLLSQAAATLPSHLSLADELAHLLNVSRDSAYRRLRGQTVLSLEEAMAVCQRFGLSLDALNAQASPGVRFERDGRSDMDIQARLLQVLGHIQAIAQLEDRHITYFSMELPFFHLIQIPELLAFKLHYWQSLTHPDMPLPSFYLDEAPASPLFHDILNHYNRIPSTEIIYESALSTTMMQILYFMESGCFRDPHDGIRLFDCLLSLSAHLKQQAVLGRKFRYGAPAPEQGPEDHFRLFYNEMVYSQNIVLIQARDLRRVFMEHNAVHFLHTSDPAFCAETESMLATILRKSTPISTVSERARNRFFNLLDQSIERHRRRAEMLLSGL